MGSLGKRKVVSLCITLAAAVAAAVVVGSGAIAGAHSAAQVKTVKLLAMSRGSFEVSLGNAPVWLPLSGTSQTLTLIAGAPKQATADNAYVGFTAATRTCASTPKKSKSPYYELSDFYSAAHSAAHDAGAFAPNGGASASTYIESVSDVRFNATSSVRACIWLATSKAVTAKKAHRSLAASLVLPLLNSTFAASVSNLTGALPGTGGYAMFAFSADHSFRYSARTVQCTRTTADGASAVSAGVPASENVSISVSPCTGDVSTFSFTGADTRNAALAYPVADALAVPPVTLSAGACELDPLTGATLAGAEAYLTAVGCTLGQIEVSPYTKSLARGSVSWAQVDGGIAEVAPASSAVDLVING
jgi:hypothetical protein